MKHLRKIMSFVIALITCLTMSNVAYAQNVGTAAVGKGSITINNAAKGETYSVVKVFGATLTNDATATTDSSGIAYTGDIPDELSAFFEKDSVGNIIKKTKTADGEVITDGAITAAVQAWAKDQPATAEAESDGSKLVFQGLEYGYYAVFSTQGTTVTIDSLKPNATINDKNSKDIVVKKEVEKDSYSIGDTVNYTGTFITVNYLKDPSDPSADAKQVIKYTIKDTLPEFLSDVAIDSITITEKDGTTPVKTITEIKNFTKGSFDIDWAEEVKPATDPKTYNNLYDNGAYIIVKYHGTLTSIANINTANINTISIHPTVVSPNGTEEHPWDEHWQDDAEIKTYGAAIKKTDENKKALDGAIFTVAGLTVEPVKDAENNVEPGVYRVVSYDSKGTTPSDQMSTNSDGMLYIIGLADDVALSVTEMKAPDGYNKLTGPVTLEPQILTKAIYETSGERHYDAKGNLVSQSTNSTSTYTVDKNYTDLNAKAVEVVNNKGTELPSTGGIGTTIFYTVGGIMVVGAVAFLLTKRRMAGNE